MMKIKNTNQEYISDINIDNLLTHKAIAIKSAMGTGKTSLAKEFVQTIENKAGRSLRVLVVTHRKVLSINLSQRFSYECYSNLDNDEITHASKLVLTVNSIGRLVAYENSAPSYDIVIIDEFTQVLNHLHGQTFENSQGLTSFNLLKSYMETAQYVLVMDAYLSSASVKWLDDVTNGDLLVINNEFHPQKGTLSWYDHKPRMIAVMTSFITEGQRIAVATTKTEAKALADRLLQLPQVQAKDILLLTSESMDRNAQRFFANPNKEVTRYKAIIYSSTLGSGVDIQTRVDAVFAVIGRVPYEATDIMQMIGRFRQAPNVHLYCPETGDLADTDEDIIYHRLLHDYIKSSFAVNFDSSRQLRLHPEQNEFAKLYASLATERQLSQNRLREDVVEKASEYYQIQHISGYNEAEEKNMAKIRLEKKKRLRDLILSTAGEISPNEFDQLKQVDAITDEIHAKHDRWYLIHYFGEVTEQTLDDYNDGKGVSKVIQLADLIRHEALLANSDYRSFEINTEMHKHKHRLRRAWMLNRGFRCLWDKGLHEYTPLTEEEVEQKLAEFIRFNRHDLQSLFGWRNDNSWDAVLVARRMTKLIGLSFTPLRSGDNKGLYAIDPQEFNRWLGYAEQLCELEDQQYYALLSSA